MTLLGGIGTMAGPIFGAGFVVALQNMLATSDFPVTIATGLIFMICVLLHARHRRGNLRMAGSPARGKTRIITPVR